MKRMVHFAALAALATSCDALAVGTIANVTVIDRDSGATLDARYFPWRVLGSGHARGKVRDRNPQIASADVYWQPITSVDGVNVLSGATAGWNQSGYVFNPGERYQVTGWRKSDAEVAAFTFTDSSNSYAERTGRPTDVGVIGVALFRERPQPVVYAPPRIAGPAREPPTPPLAEIQPGIGGSSNGHEWHGGGERAISACTRLAGAHAGPQTRHRPRRARILPCRIHGVPQAAARTRRGHTHSLR